MIERIKEISSNLEELLDCLIANNNMSIYCAGVIDTKLYALLEEAEKFEEFRNERHGN